ncbi:MAG: dihydrofolate synthase / folylpolyglutamate synthase [Hyphomonadaceae bacterium]|nr:MAG: dihydrofolate synthase / folylpolyglutamate synthase [Hyphomonadaceae bacterium]
MKKPAEITAAEIFYAFPRVIDLSLDRIRAALKPLDLILPPIIHIAGTNGKGSTLAFLRSILEAAGKTCHVYTSPHLVTIHERYVIAGKQISEEALLKYAKIVQEIAKGIPLTIFEAETLAGFLAFADTPADYLLLETGLGGRLDATNAIDQKLLTIITPIDYDHKEFLGEDLAQIAREKCGILRAKTPAIIARQREEIVDVIEHEIEIIGAIPLVFSPEDYNLRNGQRECKGLISENMDRWPYLWARSFGLMAATIPTERVLRRISWHNCKTKTHAHLY